MINIEEFTKRLQKVIDYYGESASSFAEKIGVQRSSISHILSGRNKPSLDFVLKILEAFPEVELYWLLNGKGHFPKPDLFSNNTTPPLSNLVSKKENIETKETSSNVPDEIKNNAGKRIDRIVVFYSDGSFKNYEN